MALSMNGFAQKIRQLSGKSPQQIDAALQQDSSLTTEDKIGLKIELQASLATDETIQIGMLRSDRPAPGQGGPAPRPSEIDPAMRRLLARAGVSLQGKVSVKLLDSLLRDVVPDVESRLRIKLALESENLLVDDEQASKAPTRKTSKTLQATVDKQPTRVCKSMTICASDWNRLR